MSLFPDDKSSTSADPLGRAAKMPRRPTLTVQSSRQSLPCSCMAILALGIMLLVFVPIFIFLVAPMMGIFNLYGEETRAVPGDASAFDPIASYAEIEAYARGDTGVEIDFIEMDASYVKRDGTLDLMAPYTPNVTWVFVMSVPRPDDAPPIGAGGSANDRYYQEVTIRAYSPGQVRSVERRGGGMSMSYSYRHLGLERVVGGTRNTRRDSIPPPVCSLRQLWDAAVEAGAAAEAVAVINYKADRYEFTIRDTGFRMRFGPDCAPLS